MKTRILFSKTAGFVNRIEFSAFCARNGAEIVTDWESRRSGLADHDIKKKNPGDCRI